MSDWTIEHCRSCNGPIIWAITSKDRTMPIDAEPTAHGNVVLEYRGGFTPLALVLNNTQRFGRTGLRTSHFATCPQAGSWRQGKRRAIRGAS